MTLWITPFLFIFLSLALCRQEFFNFFHALGAGHSKKNLQKVIIVLREIEETLMGGLVPSSDRWDSIRTLPRPWGSLSMDCLIALRASGGSLLPTLRRLRALAEAHAVALDDAQAKSSQASIQAGVCALFVPLLGVALHALLPGVEQSRTLWISACFGAMILTLLASIWLIRLAEKARWGGLEKGHRIWVLASQCAGERFLAWVRCGTPPDLAWTQTCQFLNQEELEGGLELATAWGSSVWETPSPVTWKGAAERSIVGAGASIKKAVQMSLMEGRPCTERVESALQALRHEIRSQIERELSILATRALKPLFFLVAPALFCLLAFGLWLEAGSNGL